MEKNTVRIAVLSDSHGMMKPKAREVIADCAYVLHAGDIVRETDLDELSVYGRLYAVRGNCDRDGWAARLRDVLRFEIAGVRFVMVHNRRDLPRDLGDADVVIFGHSHAYEETYDGGRLYLNPGSCGTGRYGAEQSMAVLTIAEGKITVRRIGLAD